MHQCRQFAADLTSVAVARTWLATELRDVAPSELIDDAQLCVSELASNAVHHGGSAFEVAIDALDDRVRITVSDESDAQPILRSVDQRSQSGRGLLIIDAVALRWGVNNADPGGKSVWCELALDVLR